MQKANIAQFVTCGISKLGSILPRPRYKVVKLGAVLEFQHLGTREVLEVRQQVTSERTRFEEFFSDTIR